MTASSGVGERLRREREARGVSLVELSRATKIRKVLLEALEAERWEELPGRIFVAGYLRAIAGHLHLDAEGLVREWESQGKKPEEVIAPLEEAASPERPSRAGWALAGVLVLAAGAGLVYWGTRGDSPPEPELPVHMAPPPRAPEPLLSKSPSPPPPEAEAPPVEVPSADTETVVEPEPKAVRTPTAEPPKPPRPPEDVPPARPDRDLVLVVSAPCWMELKAEGRRVVYREVQAGESLGFDGGPFTLTAGDASAVSVFWKGKRLSLPETPGKVLKELPLGTEAHEPPGR